MEINELKIFLAVARQGSISRAAEELNYVQSNVTTRIKQLEERFGRPLFHRKSKGVCLTASGLILCDYAQRIIQLTGEAHDALSENAVPQGPLAISSMETTAAVRLPSLLADYHRRYPQVALNLVSAPSAESLKKLLDYQVDGAFIAGEVDPQAIESCEVFEEELVLVAPLDIDPLTMESLKILVFRPGCSYRARLENWLRQNGRLGYHSVELGSIEGILACVAAGMGISILPRSVVERPHLMQNCALHELPEPVRRMTTRFVWRRHEKPSTALQVFRELLPAP
ncbi:LysR family transcriptional regulator [Desulfuromonas acetoxidans]|uniref:Transcriptional regulator, LysR family n=1 Tax=Desulfuromonas acetoxidans (strain DSM 684 / 11070) TaxID=281689 RepID=Q1K251_DESA6|nr:LysR family transcriptional regulator [Desulfuromonas acetoxidans]EAT16588.1 transcriptional regulator, LysR family [Desulfuromonas acetoxidans DSM 684]MBF0644447.1 LysR family transcriptional regulator [Desulfuromonas acetoxidans]NVD24699.1 LysR family transcriptional regulator [Desulfuromonas acetoxidans]NVE16744.1 LysR family transcriptional regulator [Desulfuromonas acetoxidans]